MTVVNFKLTMIYMAENIHNYRRHDAQYVAVVTTQDGKEQTVQGEMSPFLLAHVMQGENEAVRDFTYVLERELEKPHNNLKDNAVKYGTPVSELSFPALLNMIRILAVCVSDKTTFMAVRPGTRYMQYPTLQVDYGKPEMRTVEIFHFFGMGVGYDPLTDTLAFWKPE